MQADCCAHCVRLNGSQTAHKSAADLEGHVPSGVEHAGSIIVGRVTWIGNELKTYRKLVIVAHLKTVEDLKDGFGPRRVAA